jgi:hypothetical protein
LNDESIGDAAEVLLNRRVLQMRRKQPEAPFEDVRRSADASVGEERSGQSALRREAGVQELGLCAVHPALEQSCRAAPGRALSPGEPLRVEAENPADACGDAKRCEEAGRMKAAAMELAR